MSLLLTASQTLGPFGAISFEPGELEKARRVASEIVEELKR